MNRHAAFVACWSLGAFLGGGQAWAQAVARAGFDHPGHASAIARVGGAAAAAVPCERCHTSKAGQLVRRPDHATCFGECHGATPTRQEAAPSPAARLAVTAPTATAAPPAAAAPTANPANPANPAGRAAEQAALRARTCVACHAAADLAARRFTVAYPPYAIAPDWPASMSHPSHREVGCLRCHTVPPPPGRAAAPVAHPAAGPPHRRCLGCHTGKDNPGGAVAFAMDRCESCHRAAPAAPPTAAAPIARITVTAAFSHQTHQRYAAANPPGKEAPHPRAPAAAATEATCLRCHGGLVEAPPALAPSSTSTGPSPMDATPPPTSPAPPRLTPTAATCAAAACHDGRAAFAITERCTQCHREAPTTFYPVPRPTKRFIHRQHEAAIAAVGCQGCHRVEGAAGAVRGAGHAACASCHAADFGAAQPTTCGACHSSTEPWRTLRADRLPWESTEFGARIDHARHARHAQPCQRCHTLDTATRQLRPARDHSTCSGAGCHQLAGGAAPRLSECGECHQRDLVNERAEQRLRLPWSVRRLFDHDRHRLGPTGAAAECTSCHLAVAGPLATMPAPPKRTCEPCHDGRKAFSVTGVDCNRCHGGAR